MMTFGDKLYTVSRRDLSPGAQACQALHAFREFCEHHKEIDEEWYSVSNHICMLSVGDEIDLCFLIDTLHSNGVKYSVFKEPDMDNQITAIAIEPSGCEYLCDLPLMLSEFKEAPIA